MVSNLYLKFSELQPLDGTFGEAALFGCDTKHLTKEIYSQMGLLLDNCGLYERLTCFLDVNWCR